MPTDVIPAGNDTTPASPARIYNACLNGTSHHPANRQAADKILAAVPDAPTLAKASHAFTLRATRLIAHRGITQFLHIGCGLATTPSTHETAQATQPTARVLYVDNNPTVTHRYPTQDPGDGVAFIQADLRRPYGLLARAEEYDIDLSQPVGVLLTGVLHHIAWPDAPHLHLNELTRRLAPGSYLALSHITSHQTSPEIQTAIETAYADASTPVFFRKPLVIKHFFDGLHMIRPGWTDITQWRANGQKTPTQPCTLKILAGVARKPPAPRPGQ